MYVIDRCLCGSFVDTRTSLQVYAFMCPECSGNGPNAAAQLVNNLRGNSVKFGMMYVTHMKPFPYVLPL